LRIALLGGSFDPPHNAHQLACQHLLEDEGFDRVWLLPCYQHAFGKALTHFSHRLEMCALSAKKFSGRVVVSEVEQNLAGEDGNRTIDTVEYLQAHHPQEEFTLVIGSDILSELDGWKDVDRLKNLVPFLVLGRSGFKEPTQLPQSPVTLPEISSSQVRELLRAGRPVRDLVPEEVASYIRENSLYRS